MLTERSFLLLLFYSTQSAINKVPISQFAGDMRRDSLNVTAAESVTNRCLHLLLKRITTMHKRSFVSQYPGTRSTDETLSHTESAFLGKALLQ